MPRTPHDSFWLGRYQPIYLLATGGMAEIWSCLDRKTHQMVAVKKLMPHTMEEIRQNKSGMLEEHALRSIRHPHVLEFIEMGYEGDALCFVTELIPGMNMDHYILRQRLSTGQFLMVAPQLLDAVGAIHRIGLVHGDIKPENMMVEQDEEKGLKLKMLDFGTADLLPPVGSASAEGTHKDILATAEYIAPELVRGKPPGVSSDIYATGMSFYHFLTGHPAFDKADPVEVMRAHLNENPVHLSVQRKDIPSDICDWVMSFLMKEAIDRPATTDAALISFYALPTVRAALKNGPDKQALAQRPKGARVRRAPDGAAGQG